MPNNRIFFQNVDINYLKNKSIYNVRFNTLNYNKNEKR